MKAKLIDGNIITYKHLPKTYTKSDGSVVLNFHTSDTAELEAEGFYDLVKPSYNQLTQDRGGLQWDEENKIFTFPITDKDFDATYEERDEDGELTGNTLPVYDVDALKATTIKGLKGTAGFLLQPTDWEVIRKAERGTEISTATATERAKILTECDRKEAEVSALTTYAEVLQYNKTFFPPSESPE